MTRFVAGAVHGVEAGVWYADGLKYKTPPVPTLVTVKFLPRLGSLE